MITIKLIQTYIDPQTYDTKGILYEMLSKRRTLALNFISEKTTLEKQHEIKEEIIKVNLDIANHLGLILS